MPLIEKHTKEYTLPLEEFKAANGITGKVTQISYYQTCREDKKDDKIEYITIEVELE